MAAQKFPHIFLQDIAETIIYKSPQRIVGGKNIPRRNRLLHSARILKELENAWNKAKENKDERSAVSLPTKDGIYLEFRSLAGYDLVTKSLENLKQSIRLLNVKDIALDDNKTTIATVYLPAGKETYFLHKIKQYADEDRNVKLAESIQDVRLAVLESFWCDKPSLIPGRSKEWCEVWLRVKEGEASRTEERFFALCSEYDIEYKPGKLRFPERSVLLVKANKKDLTEFIERCSDIAEFRLSKETAAFWMELPNEEQVEWIQELLDRIRINDSNISVCILDTGANNGHPLLSHSLVDSDCLSIDPRLGTNDIDGHGTSMCGVALYGDLQVALLSTSSIEINHTLESVKLLRRSGDNQSKELWGHLTSQAISLAEIQNPSQQRIHCMAVTSDDRDRGRPSSWSAAIDAISSGSEEDEETKRLLIISAGNIREPNEWNNYPVSNQTNSVHDPGQAWNALTVGAVTYKTTINNPNYQGYTPIAASGELSPFSTTSCIWERKWPIKPEIVLEGGNAGRDNTNFTTEIDDLSILTTHNDYINRSFTVINATSAATAEASRLAAIIQAEYPNAWPETVRALIVHSANWTEELKQQFGVNQNSDKSVYSNLMRTCGYGVPDIERALHCARNSLTLISQETIQPYMKKQDGQGYATKDMHIYELPWPKDVLLAQGNLPVRLRVTLSYFIEPGPGEIGWRDRYRYPSYGFRFDMNSPSETIDQFKGRLNMAARTEGEEVYSESASSRWLIGSNTRHLGSLHSDIWEGTAAELATCNLVGVYPVIGWWRERAYLNRWDRSTRYSLIISLDTDDQDIDIYTPVESLIKTAITIRIP